MVRLLGIFMAKEEKRLSLKTVEMIGGLIRGCQRLAVGLESTYTELHPMLSVSVLDGGVHEFPGFTF